MIDQALLDGLDKDTRAAIQILIDARQAEVQRVDDQQAALEDALARITVLENDPGSNNIAEDAMLSFNAALSTRLVTLGPGEQKALFEMLEQNVEAAVIEPVSS